MAAVFSVLVPVLVALQTQFDKKGEPKWYLGLTLTTIMLSLISTICVVVERRNPRLPQLQPLSARYNLIKKKEEEKAREA